VQVDARGAGAVAAIDAEDAYSWRVRSEAALSLSRLSLSLVSLSLSARHQQAAAPSHVHNTAAWAVLPVNKCGQPGMTSQLSFIAKRLQALFA